MSKTFKIIIGCLAALIILFLLAFAASRYLVSRLDGTGDAVLPTEHTIAYRAESLGVSFSYPDHFTLEVHQEGSPERLWHTLVLLPKGYVPPVNGEGPPTISVSVIPNPEHLSLETWIKSDARSNFKLSESQGLVAQSLDSEPALGYKFEGLYPTHAVAAAYKDNVYLITGSYQLASDPIYTDFADVILSVHFLP